MDVDLYISGTPAWIHTGSTYVLARVVKRENESLLLQDIGGTDHHVKLKDAKHDGQGSDGVMLANPSSMDFSDDLTTLTYLHEPAVLHCIKSRYSQQIIYTYSGIVLIALNPFARLNLYSHEIARAYGGKRKGELEPHLFAIAEDAYRQLERGNQSIIVSGESGAGKTVSAKYIMRYFATVDSNEEEADPHAMAALDEHHTSNMSISNINPESSIEEQVLATNPITESFGNAKTTRNDNSSRFGKYIEIQFNDKNEIIGARLRTYLLERSRVVFQPQEERNYHVFYQLCEGVPLAEKKELGLLKSDHFEYLKKCTRIQGVDDAREFSKTVEALSTIGISVQKQWCIFRLLASILHLGNVTIKGTDEGSIEEGDESLNFASKLLGLKSPDLKKWIVNKQIKTRSETITTKLSKSQALANLNSISKFVYNRQFDWLIEQINKALSSESRKFIGVLDIYGFEHFPHNSFEQFCINYANEKLQQEFNRHVFKLEQEEYLKEEISWSFIEFNDNKECLDLIEKNIIALLDEECRLLSGSENQLITKIHGVKNPYLSKPRFAKSSFIIKHYACLVEYELEGFLEKNRDSLPEQVVGLLVESSDDYIKQLFSANQQVTTSKTVSSSFKLSLSQLMDTIQSTNVHYIRCIKPNENKKPFEFDSEYILGQLRACGVLETIRISLAGYPTRFFYSEFVERYRVLRISNEKDEKAASSEILAKFLTADSFQLGLTKIFLRSGQYAMLERFRQKKIEDAATLIQKNIKMRLQRRKYLRIRTSIIQVQATSRMFLKRKQFRDYRLTKNVIIIQALVRMFIFRTRYLKVRAKIVKIQSACRMYLARTHYLQQRRELAATMIQKTWRGYTDRNKYKEFLRRLITVQSAVRRHQAITQLKTLKIEQRSIKKIEQKAFSLEKKVFDLTQQLVEKSQEIQAVAQARDKVKEKADRLETLLRDKQLEVDHAKEENKSLEKRMCAKMTELEKSLSEKEEEIIKLKQKVHELEASNEELKNRKTIVNTAASLPQSPPPTTPTPRSPSIVPLTPSKIKKLPLTNNLSKLFKDPSLDKEINEALIAHLMIPPTLPPDMRPKKEVLFPSHILSVALLQLLRYELVDRFKLVFGNAMNEIRLSLKYDDSLSSIYWLSNLFELYQLLKPFASALQKQLDQLNFFIIEVYYNLLKELKKKLNPLIIPCVIEHQGLPAFLESTQVSYFSFQKPVLISMDKLLQFFNRHNEIMQSFYLNDSIRRQIFSTLMKIVGTTGFNHLLMRRGFCSWRRGMQIQYNLTRLEEWCSKNDLEESSLHLEAMMQATKLLQLNKHEVDLMFDVCFLLSPQQIKKVLSMYHPAEYESPIPQEVFNSVQARCLDDQGFLMEIEDSPYMMPESGNVAIEPFVPKYLEGKLTVLQHVLNEASNKK